MKKLDKVILILFSVIILISTIVVNLLIIGWLDLPTVGTLIRSALIGSNTHNIVLAFSFVCMILAIKCIFFDTTEKKDTADGQGILMQNDNGKLMISKTTLESLVNSIIKDFDSVEDVSTRIALDSENNVSINIILTVSKNVIIKELTLNMQNKIKETIKRTSDLEVKEVNVKIKNIALQDAVNKK